MSAEVQTNAAGGGWVTARPPRGVEVLGRLVRFPALVLEHRDLVSTSVRRELESRFTGTILGWAWPLVHPIFLFAVYYFIFTRLLEFKIPDLPPGQEGALGVYMFVGIMAWAAIAEALIRGTNAIVENGNLIKKLAFPSEVLPLTVTAAGIVTLTFSTVVFLVACLVTPIWTRPGAGILWVPLLLFIQAVFTYGLALFLSTLQVFLRDTLQVVGILTTVWMFATPLFWVPELGGEGLAPYLGFVRANPVYHLVTAWRGALMGEVRIGNRLDADGTPLPDLVPVDPSMIGHHVAVFAVWAGAAFVLGYVFFVLSQRRFADEI